MSWRDLGQVHSTEQRRRVSAGHLRRKSWKRPNAQASEEEALACARNTAPNDEHGERLLCACAQCGTDAKDGGSKSDRPFARDLVANIARKHASQGRRYENNLCRGQVTVSEVVRSSERSGTRIHRDDETADERRELAEFVLERLHLCNCTDAAFQRQSIESQLRTVTRKLRPVNFPHLPVSNLYVSRTGGSALDSCPLLATRSRLRTRIVRLPATRRESS